MVLQMSRPSRHPKTGVYWFRKAVPADVRSLVGKREITRTLRTKDPNEARIRHAEVAAEIDRHWKALRSPAITLSHKEVVALAGTWYAEFVKDMSDFPGPPDVWHHMARVEREVRESGKLEQWSGSSVDQLLAREGLHVDADTRARLMEQLSTAHEQAAEHLKRNAEGDYSPDPKAGRFPAWAAPASPTDGREKPDMGKKITLSALLEGWWREAERTGRKQSTYDSFSHAIKSLIKFIGHDDADRVTPDNVIAFKDHLLSSVNPKNGKPLSTQTIKNSYLAGLNVVFKWALANRKLATNPAVGVTLKVTKKAVTRSKGFTDKEASAILQACDALMRGQEKPKTFAAKRWVPWLCAYTGARVGELAQLRKEDVRQEGEHWVIRITPDAGTVKTSQARDVVLHAHLIEKGFPTFVATCPPGPLFLTPAKATGDILGPLGGVKNRLAEFARQYVTDMEVKPNHGWRHRFKTLARNADIDQSVRDAIQGHGPSSVADSYGNVAIEAMVKAMAKFPRQG